MDLKREDAAKLAGELSASGAEVRDYCVDITDYEKVRKACESIESELGPIDVLINNAGWDHAAKFVDTDPYLWTKLISINLIGPLNLQHSIVPKMLERGFGRVINISSDAGRVGSSGESVYSACKGGLISFSKTLAREVARKQITVNVVCPGPTDTALFRDFAGSGESGEKLKNALQKAIPFGRLGTPDDLVGAVCFLASDDAAFITGQVISVSGGLTMAG
jgi:2-hydroxycyclohexanecarboxyl-CoA dehydrogenase